MAALDDDKRQDGLVSDANTMVETPEHDIAKSDGEKLDSDAEKTDIDAERADLEGDHNSRNGAAVLPEDTLAPDDYPKGFQFFFILLSLMLTIFMVALDMVCSCFTAFLSSSPT
jgi:hypothetical protein